MRSGGEREKKKRKKGEEEGEKPPNRRSVYAVQRLRGLRVHPKVGCLLLKWWSLTLLRCPHKLSAYF